VLARRLLILLAVLLGLSALAASVAPPQRPLGDFGAPAPTQAPPVQPAPQPPRTIARTIVADRLTGPARVRARVGDTVQLVVRSSRLDSVAVADLAPVQAVEADSPAQFEILADMPGSYPITFVESGRRIGLLEVR
jgi:hypothetical protein